MVVEHRSDRRLGIPGCWTVPRIPRCFTWNGRPVVALPEILLGAILVFGRARSMLTPLLRRILLEELVQ